MGYIKQKPCKHIGCDNYPAMACGGFCWEHREEDPGYERKQRKFEAKKEVSKIRMLTAGMTEKSGYVKPVENKLVDNAAAKEFKSLIGLKQWFEDRRKELTGMCQCGCGEPSSKNDDKYFRHSCCHIFPKKTFLSIATHPLNCIERAFWGGCHTNLDEQSMDRWPNMADWQNIKQRFFVLVPLLTNAEKATKFYTQLERLVNEN